MPASRSTRTDTFLVFGIALALGAAGWAAEADDPPVARTLQELEQHIEEAGKTAPAWLDDTPLEYPETLNLDWEKVAEGWQPNINLQTHVFGVIGRNATTLRRGIRLMHHVLEVNKDDPEKAKRTMTELGRLYAHAEEHVQAAYWHQKAGVNRAEDAIAVAVCYHKLGCPQAAVNMLNRVQSSGRTPVGLITAWAEIGQMGRAKRLAEQLGGTSVGDAAFLAMGNACRRAGEYGKALGYYRRCQAVRTGNRRNQANKNRARSGLEALAGFADVNVAAIPDGTYEAESRGYRGPVKVAVTVKDGRIESVRVAQHREDRTLGGEVATPTHIVEKQGIKGVDAVTGASTTTDAILNATAKALTRAGK